MKTLIIGGGWSGLSAAVRLTEQSHSVHLVESAKQLGGRARSVSWQGRIVDNGQHLMTGAYRHMLAMMALIGLDPKQVFNRLPIDLVIHNPNYGPLVLSGQGRLPWPLSLAWNLVKSTGLGSLKNVAMLHKDIPRLLLEHDITVQTWLHKTNQPKRLIDQLWAPLCLAALNTPIATASAHVLAVVLRETLGQGKAAADLLIPKVTLNHILPQAAANYIQQQGGKISQQTRITQIVVEKGRVAGAITANSDFIKSNNIILATGPDQTAQLLATHLRFLRPKQIPVTTIYLQYPSHLRLPKPLLGMSGTMSHWLFDRSEQCPGMIAVVISAEGPHEKYSKTALIDQVCSEIHQLLPYFPKKPDKGLVIREKRATFDCTVENHFNRPNCTTAISGLWLAGDYIANDYPATLEGAIRNGEHCAQLLLSHLTSTDLGLL